MRKKVRIYLASAVLLVFAAWGMFFFTTKSDNDTFNELVTEGDALYENEIYIDAVTCYSEALEIDPESFDTWIKLAESYKNLGDENMFVSSCEQAIEVDPNSAEPYILMAEYYSEKGEVDTAIAVLSAPNEVDDKSEINELLDTLMYQYERTYMMYDSVKSWFGGFAVVEKSGEYGLVSSDLEVIIEPSFQEMGMIDLESNLIPVKKDNQWYYIDSQGYKKASPENNPSHLGTYSENRASIEIDGMYYMMDENQNVFEEEFKYVGAMKNGVVAVQNTSGTWQLMDEECESISKDEYDEIILDDYGFCSTYGAIFVVNDGKVSLVDLNGKPISNQEFDGAKPFASEEPAAVKIGDKWGFVSIEGEIVIEPTYEDAKSFSNGLAAVKQDGKWGYIDENGEFKIPPSFEEAMPFSEDGTAAVKNGHYWEFIKINSQSN